MVKTENGAPVLSRRFFVPRAGTEAHKERERLLRALGFVLCYAFTDDRLPTFVFYLEDENGNVTEMRQLSL